MSDVQEHDKATTGQTSPVPQRGLRILVAGQVGNTGKSTVSANVVYAHLGGRFFSVDSVNQDASQYGTEVERVLPDEIPTMRMEMLREPGSVVVDLGASDFAAFLDKMAAANMAKTFDYVLIVTDASRRGQEEAIVTFETLRSLGMPEDAFRIVLNRAKIGGIRKASIRSQYPVVFGYKDGHPGFPVNESGFLPEHDMFTTLQLTGQTYKEAINDKTEYEPMILQAELEGRTRESIKLSQRNFAQMLAESAKEYFDRLYANLNIQQKR